MVHADKTVTVYVIDGDASLRRAVGRLLYAEGMTVHGFGSVGEFLVSRPGGDRACVLADATVDEHASIDVLRMLRATGLDLPVVLMTAGENGDLRAAARSAGAAALLHKPVDGQALIDTIEWALEGADETAVGRIKDTGG